jgi:hypothetical protein
MPLAACDNGFGAFEVFFMKRKVFWGTFLMLGLLADIVLPLFWGIVATIPLVFLSWWIAYKSDWFE